MPQVKEQGGVWTLSSSQDGKLMLKVLTLKFRQGGFFGITDPDLNIDIAEHGAIPALEHEAWERLSNETKFRHERRKITILLKLLGDSRPVCSLLLCLTSSLLRCGGRAAERHYRRA